MRPPFVQQAYRAVSTQDHDNSTTRASRKVKQQQNFKPIPLRISFLAAFIFVFAACIILIEVLLRSTIEPPSSTTTTATPSPSTKLKFSRPKRQVQQNHLQPRQTGLNCANAAAIPGQIASAEAAVSSLCVEFTSSYAAHTKNLSYPQQTSLEQWLASFSAASSSSVELTLTSKECQPSKTVAASSAPTSSPEGDNAMKEVRVGCETTMVNVGEPDCYAGGDLAISGFSLVTQLSIWCAASTSRELAINTPTPSASPNPQSGPGRTVSEITSSVEMVIATPAASPVISTPSPQTTQSVTKGSDIALSSPSPSPVSTTVGHPAPSSELVDPQSSVPTPAAGQASPLPTITQAAPVPETVSSQPAPTAVLVVGPASSLGTNTNPAGQVQPSPVSVTPGAQIVTIPNTFANGQVQTLVATAAVVPLPTTFVTTNMNGEVQTVVSSPPAAIPAGYTFVTTGTNGQVQTFVSTASATASATAPGLFLYATTDPNGQVQTLTTQIQSPPIQPSNGPAALQTLVITNGQGQIETLVGPASAIVPTMTTYTTTDAQGRNQVITASAYALVGAFTTYTTTDSQGQAETVVSKLSDTSSARRYTTTTQFTSLIRTTDAAGRSTTFSAVIVQTVTLSSSPSPDNASKTSTAVAPASTSPRPVFVVSSQEKMVNAKFTYGSYMLALYLPAFLAVIVKAAWGMVFAAIRLIQPFERMAGAHGATAEDSIFAEYLSTSLSWDAFTSLAQGNFVPLWASVLWILVQAGAPVATISMTVKARSYCSINGVQMRCDPVWVVNVPLLRAVEALLAVSIALVLLILWSTRRSKSGIASDPSSLASLAGLMNYRPLLGDIQRISPDADSATFQNAMAQHRFMLNYHGTSQNDLSYGIVGVRRIKNDDAEHPDAETNHLSSNAYASNTDRNAYNYHSIPNPGTSVSSSYTRTTFLSRARNHLLTDTLGLLFPLTIFTLVLTWYFDSNNDPLNNFFNSNTLWPKFVLVALATLCALHLYHLERVVRITEPFRRLASTSSTNGAQRHRPSPPETTLLISRSGTPYSNFLQCFGLFFSQDVFRRRSGKMSFQTLVTVTAILADLNIIAVAGVAFNDAQTWQVYQVSSISSITLSGWIALVYLVILLWWRRCESVRAVSEDAMGVSVGVGTLGGAMRWLLSGRNPQNVLEAIVNVKEEAEGWRGRRWNEDTEYRGRDGELNVGRPSVWFGKLGVVGASGRERWGFGVDGHTEVQERTWMNRGVHERGVESLGGHEEYFGPRARGQNRSSESLDREQHQPETQTQWQGGRYPSLSGHHGQQAPQAQREEERLWTYDGDLGRRRSSVDDPS